MYAINNGGVTANLFNLSPGFTGLGSCHELLILTLLFCVFRNYINYLAQGKRLLVVDNLLTFVGFYHSSTFISRAARQKSRNH